MKKLKPNTLVKCVNEETRRIQEFAEDESFLYLGEVTNMKDHCVIADLSGRITWGWHTDNFVALTDEET